MSNAELNTAKDWVYILSGHPKTETLSKLQIMPQTTKQCIAQYIGSENNIEAIAKKLQELPYLFSY